MKLLCFLVRAFRWQAHQRTLVELGDPIEPGDHDEVAEALVIFFHAEAKDVADEARVFKHALKHTKWLANKGRVDTIVLHSFAHLGGDTAAPEFARKFVDRLSERLEGTGYIVKQTPFGWFSSWSIDVLGDSLAKVFKQI